MIRNPESGEHILVCLSPSPSNPKVIEAAAKMAEAFQASLTAIYVRPESRGSLREEDRTRLQNNIRFAEKLGASITTLVGDDVPARVAEYAHISGTTKIVIGRSGIGRRHFWNKTTLTEQIIVNAPDVDVYIIPDSAADFTQRKDRLYLAWRIRPTLKDLFVTVLLLAASTGTGLLFTQFGFSDSNIITVFILGVLVISVLTDSPVCGALGSLAGVLLFNWFFIDPRFSFHTYEAEYPVTFAIMLVSSLITGTLAGRIKRNASQAAREAFRTKVLLDTSQLLQKAASPEDAMRVTAGQIIMLLNRDVIIYPRTDGGRLGEGRLFETAHKSGGGERRDEDEGEIAVWVFQNRLPAGYRTDHLKEAKAQYHAICLNDYCYGVIAVCMDGIPPEPFENSIVTYIIGECALALENHRNAREKEQASLIARNEQLRSNLLRSISHDIRTPLTSISGNADNLLRHYGQLDGATLTQIFTDIYDDAEWLTGLVENLLSVSRIENGGMKLNRSLEVMGDVIDEALKHIDRNTSRHRIEVRDGGEMLLVDMDASLIMQVLINLINNAVKHTPSGSAISIASRREGDRAVVSVTDDGPGIPDDLKPHVFELFFTGKSPVADGRRGPGLGLTLCRSIVEAHGGSISLEDNVPSGCRFSISLPLREVTADE